MRVTRYIRQHHIGLVALFIALTGTAYAGTQVAGHQVNPQALKAKKKKVKRGPQGPPGAQGIPGANGSARAYGAVSGQGIVDTARSSPGVTAVRTGVGNYCVTVPGLTRTNTVIVPVMDTVFADSQNGQTAAAALIPVCGNSFGVTTFTAAGAVEDAGFDFVIP